MSATAKQEAQRILGSTEESIPELAKMLGGLGPKTVFISDGPRGAYAFDGNRMWKTPMYPDPKPPVDRTGAGDAFASTVTAMLARGKSIPEALSYGPVNSMSVVQEVGAQKGLLSLETIEKLLSEKPAGYEVQEV
jgi:sugar/nucleoside kinase (ribokinase family)